MNITKTGHVSNIPLIMLIYGMAGVGKTTLASTFPNTLFLDFESGTKYLTNTVDVISFPKWPTPTEAKELTNIIRGYDTIVVDSLSEAMQKLIESENISGKKNRQNDGELTMSGWGKVKQTMRSFISFLRDSQKNVLLLTHVDEVRDEQAIYKRPLIATKLSDEITNMVDVVGYMFVRDDNRHIYVGGSYDRIISKDRTARLPKTIVNPTHKDFVFHDESGGVPHTVAKAVDDEAIEMI